MLTTITQIKPSLANAIAHDISSHGKAIAEVVDREMGVRYNARVEQTDSCCFFGRCT